jgi:hypothetical protein
MRFQIGGAALRHAVLQATTRLRARTHRQVVCELACQLLFASTPDP